MPTSNIQTHLWGMRLGYATALTPGHNYYYLEISPYIHNTPYQTTTFRLYTNDDANPSTKNRLSLISCVSFGLLNLLGEGYKSGWISKEIGSFFCEGLKYGLVCATINMYSGYYNQIPVALANQNCKWSYGLNIDYFQPQNQYWLEAETGLVFNNMVELALYHNFGFNGSGIKIGTSMQFE